MQQISKPQLQLLLNEYKSCSCISQYSLSLLLLCVAVQVKLDKQEERLNALQDEVHKLATNLE